MPNRRQSVCLQVHMGVHRGVLAQGNDKAQPADSCTLVVKAQPQQGGRQGR